MPGWNAQAGNYFFFMLVFFVLDQCFVAFFRVVALTAPDMELAQTIGGALTGVLNIFCGYFVFYTQLPGIAYPLWYISPFSWMMTSIVDNEFNTPLYQQPGSASAVPGYAGSNATVAEIVFITYGYQNSLGWQWGGVVYIIALSALIGLLGVACAVQRLKAAYAPGFKRHAASPAGAEAVAAQAADDSAVVKAMAAHSSLWFRSPRALSVRTASIRSMASPGGGCRCRGGRAPSRFMRRPRAVRPSCTRA
jgi:hypothetical protein